ncbi:Sulfotransferase domain [Sesbania bispinosa]|nr:Sulfotransferase domain [Sesbania bispinosa]
MIQQILNLHKDSVDIKSIKKSPLTLRLLAVLVFLAAVYGICICSINLEQPWVRKNTKLLELRGVNQSCHPSGVEEWEVPYLHYPQPKTYSREECACNPVRFFSILSMQRSGSGWFETLLNSHINVSSNGEIFSVAKRRENVSSILKTMDEVYNLDWFSSASKNECSAAVGYKWMLNQGLMDHHKEIVEYFQRKRVSAIFLFRRNLLGRVVSVLANSYDKDAKPLNGTHKSHVHSTIEAKVLAKYRPRINTTLLMPELKRIEETATKAIEYFKNTRHIVLYYEDLVKNRTKLKDVQEFLRLPYRELHSRQVKIHTAPLSNQIENWDEVQEELKGTPYQSFLLSD